MQSEAVEVHPAAKVFPEMSETELEKLKDDISENGQLVPITYWGGKLLDGRHRLKACEQLGIDPIEEELDEELVPDPFQWVISANLHRRHLTNQQRAMVAARVATQKQGARTDLSPNGETSRDEAAELLQVSPRAIDRAKHVIKNASADVVAAVERNELPLSKAEKLTKELPDKREQSKLVKQGKKAVTDWLKALVTPPAKEKPARARKSVPEVLSAFRRSENKANDLRVLIEELEPSMKTLLKEWLTEN